MIQQILSYGQCKLSLIPNEVVNDAKLQNSVEGGIIIIACSIPLLQPILDLCFRHHPLSTHVSPNRHHYNSRATNGTNANRSHFDKRTTRTTDDFEIPLRDEGKELELEHGHTYRTAVVSRQSSSVFPTNEDGSDEYGAEENGAGLAMRGILRTQVVTVSYADKDSVPSGSPSAGSGLIFPRGP